jgi:hypothetical protein
MGLRDEKEALTEFMRIKTPEIFASDKYLEEHALKI